MAVTRRVHSIHIADGPFYDFSPRPNPLQVELNKRLSSSERIVHMEHETHSQQKWIVITEELIMGPVP